MGCELEFGGTGGYGSAVRPRDEHPRTAQAGLDSSGVTRISSRPSIANDTGLTRVRAAPPRDWAPVVRCRLACSRPEYGAGAAARQPSVTEQGRQDSNLQPPVLETGALPIELRPWVGCRLYRRPPPLASRRGRTPATARARRALHGARGRLRRRCRRGADRRRRDRREVADRGRCARSGGLARLPRPGGFPRAEESGPARRILPGEWSTTPRASGWIPEDRRPALRDRLILTYAPLVKYVAGGSAPGFPPTWTRATSSRTACSA